MVKINFIYFELFLLHIYWLLLHGVKQKLNYHQKRKPFQQKKQILFTTSVSIFNPHAITDTIMVIGSNSIQYQGSTKLAYTVSCIIISWLWFYSLALAGNKLHKLSKAEFWIKMY